MKQFTFLSLFCILLSNSGMARPHCKIPIAWHPKDNNSISSVFQFTFLHKKPRTLADTVASEVENPNIKHIINHQALLESLAKRKTQEALMYLYISCTGVSEIEDMTLFARQCDIVRENGGALLLNRYFLNGIVNEKLPKEKFLSEVLSKCSKIMPAIYYCNAVAPERYGKNRMQSEIDMSFSECVHCPEPIPVTEDNIGDIHNIYELTCFNKAPQNGIDSFIIAFSKRDYTTYNYHEMLRALAISRSKAVFDFLYVCLATPAINISTNEFHTFCNELKSTSVRLLNRYYLDSSVSEDQHEKPLRDKVLELCHSRRPVLYYCKQPTMQELYARKMRDIPISRYDRKIIRSIKHHANLNKGNSLQKIKQEIADFPFVYDVMTGDCYDVLAIYPGYINLYVEIEKDGLLAERVYSMRTSKMLFRYPAMKRYWNGIRIKEKWRDNYLCNINASYCPDCLAAAREYCLKKETTLAPH